MTKFIPARFLAVLLALFAALSSSAHAGDFAGFLEALWPEAKSAGVSRATFDRAFAGVMPDYNLPDLELAGKPKVDNSGQAEFTKTAADYISKPTWRSWLAKDAPFSTSIVKH